MNPGPSSAQPADQAWWRVRLLMLALAVLAVYYPVRGHDFIMFDDQEYIYNNPAVPHGLTWDGVVWAFTQVYASNWHPLTWISHMIDVQLFGFNPGPHHLVSLMFHLANTLLLFHVLRRLTGEPWPALLVAALFALHPLHVESVAWAAERKDVLSAFFWLLTMLAYVRYVEKPEAKRYGAMLASYAAALLCKPMVVTLPCVLLLLDVWPLRRPARGWWPLVREKLPLFAMVAALSIVTLLAQQKAMATLEVVPVTARLANAVSAYGGYLAKAFWPVDLAIFYPHSMTLEWTPVLLAGAMLIAVTWFVLAHWRARPWLLVGWLWYLGTLVPVIGVLQVGSQSMANRYTYLPLVGIFIIVAWGGVELIRQYPGWKNRVLAFATAALLLCVAVSRREVGFWADTYSIFERAAQVTGPNAVAEENLGWAYLQLGRYAESQAHYRRLVEIAPDPYALTHYGDALRAGGDLTNALTQYEHARELEPDNAAAWNGLALARLELGDPDEALKCVERALAAHPDWPEALTTRGQVLTLIGQSEAASASFKEALQLTPGFARAQLEYGMALLREDKNTEALRLFVSAVQAHPRNEDVRYGLALALLANDERGEGFKQLIAVVDRKPWHVDARDRLARVTARSGHPEEAVKLYEEGLAANASAPSLLAGLAWLRATSADGQFRDGAQAVQLAERAVAQPTGGTPRNLDVLAAAHAEAGDFKEAVRAEQRALAARPAVADLPAMQARLKLYEAGQPYRQK